MLIEKRGMIKHNIEEATGKLEAIGALFRGHYFFDDIIFLPKFGKTDLAKEVLRLRILQIKNWETKDVLLDHKMYEGKGDDRMAKIVLHQEFDNQAEAFDFIKGYQNGRFQQAFDFFREGWEYHLGDSRIFLEQVEYLGPTVEILTDDEEHLHKIVHELGIGRILTDPLPKILSKKYKSIIKSGLRNNFR
jgi:adenylate cyclase class IV